MNAHIKGYPRPQAVVAPDIPNTNRQCPRRHWATISGPDGRGRFRLILDGRPLPAATATPIRIAISILSARGAGEADELVVERLGGLKVTLPLSRAAMMASIFERGQS
jgi:hypothetical protein